jgi:hypothetical protein
MSGRVIHLPVDINWESLPGFVSKDTVLKYRFVVGGFEVTCDTAEEAQELIGLCQRDYDCLARRFQVKP